MQKAWTRKLLGLGVAALACGCASTPDAPQVAARRPADKPLAVFESEAGACQREAAERVAPAVSAANRRALGGALLSAAVGAGAGAAAGGRDTDVKVVGNALIVPAKDGLSAGEGAAIGAGAGAAVAATGLGLNGAEAQDAIQRAFDAAFASCMRLAGNATPGFEPPQRPELPRAFSPPQPTGRVRRDS